MLGTAPNPFGTLPAARPHEGAARKPAGTGPVSAFTLIELLVTIAIIGTLAALVIPAVFGAQVTAQVTRVRSDLRQMDLALHDYWLHFEAYPPSRLYCNTDRRDQHRCMPEELWRYGFLGGPLYDHFNPGQPYRYTAVGPGYVNGNRTPISLWVPATFPEPGGTLVREGDSQTSPLKWVAWSVGPNGPSADFSEVLQLHPADPGCWYPRDPRGIIVRYHNGDCGISPE